MSRVKEYVNYHYFSMMVGDIDPQNPALRYICERFELNIEQRYWLAFLFGCTYCAPTVYYIYNEFPDFENVDANRLQRWWDENKSKCKFQTDRLRIKTGDKFVETFLSYKKMIGSSTQERFFKEKCRSPIPTRNYLMVWETVLSRLKNFGRFSNFIYLELLYEICDLNIWPENLDVKNALSCRNGLCYAFGYDQLIDEDINQEQVNFLEMKFGKLTKYLQKNSPVELSKTDESFKRSLKRISAWSVETSLCAYKKHKRGKRWVGYYVDRQHDEIKEMEEKVANGVDWKPLWDFRKEFFNHQHLTELTNKRSSMESPYVS